MAYTISTLAQRWDCTEMTVRRLISEGKLKAFRVGRLWRITEAEVLRYENK